MPSRYGSYGDLLFISWPTFYFLEILECKFATISKYKKIITAKEECHHTCLAQCHVNPGEKIFNSMT